MSTTGAQLPYVKFLPNLPVDLAFKFADGKPISGKYGPSVMFTTTKDELAFFHPTEAAEIEALRLAPGEPLRITRTRDEKNRQYLKFEKLGAQPDGTFVVPKGNGGASPRSIPPSASSGAHPFQSTPQKANNTNTHSGSQDNTGGSGAGGRPMADSPYEHSGIAAMLREHTNMLVDVMGSVVEYSKKYNGSIRNEDIRTLLITVYIQHTKGPRQ